MLASVRMKLRDIFWQKPELHSSDNRVAAERRVALVISFLSPIPVVALSFLISPSLYPLGPWADDMSIFVEQLLVVATVHLFLFLLAWVITFSLLNRLALPFIRYREQYNLPLFWGLIWRAAFVGGIAGLSLVLLVLLSYGISMIFFVDSYYRIYNDLRSWGVGAWSYGFLLVLFLLITSILAAILYWIFLKGILKRT